MVRLQQDRCSFNTSKCIHKKPCHQSHQIHQECRLGNDFLEAKPNSVPPPEKKKIWFGGGASLDKVNTQMHWVHTPLHCAW